MPAGGPPCSLPSLPIIMYAANGWRPAPQVLRPFVLRRLKANVAGELPKKVGCTDGEAVSTPAAAQP